MSRRSDDRRKIEEENYDYESLISPGITMLKFGKGGTPHERLFRLSGDLRYLSWYSGWFCKKLGATCCG